jgi:hypothetical protein
MSMAAPGESAMTYTVERIERADDDDPLGESCAAAGCRQRGRLYAVWMRGVRSASPMLPDIEEIRLCGRHAAEVRARAMDGGTLTFCGYRVLL